MNRRELQARLEALEQYVYSLDKALHLLEREVENVSVIFSSDPVEKSLEEVEREMDEFIEHVSELSAAADGPAPF